MQLSLFILIFILAIAGADGDPPQPTLSIMLLHYENLKGVLADGKPCSPFSFVGLQCTMEMAVTIAMGEKNLGKVDLGQVTSASNKVDFTETTYKDWSNPKTIQLDDKPYEGFNLTVEITSHGLPVDSWTHQFADGTQLQGVSSFTSSRAGLLGTTLTLAWRTDNVSPPTSPAPTTTTAGTTTSQAPIPYPKSCDEILDDRTDGPKQIYINDQPVEVYCQFGIKNAYTVIQSRGSADDESFDKSLDEYKAPFGKPGKGNNFWLGLDNMVALTADGSYSLLIELCCGGENVQQQFYENFQVSPGPDYKLSAVAKDRPSIGLDFYSTNSQMKDINSKFTTYNEMSEDQRDNCEILRYYGDKDDPILDKQTGGWWFGSCGNNLNGKFVASSVDNKCRVAEEFAEKTTGIEMRTTKGMIPPGRAFDGVSYDRVRMAVYKSGEIPVVSNPFCK